MFPSGYFSIPYSVTGVGISDPTTAPLVGDQSQIVDSDRTRLKRLRAGTNVTLDSTDDAITISSSGSGTSIALSDPIIAPQVNDVSLRADDHTVKRLRPSSSRITCTSLPDCIALDVVDVDLALGSSGSGYTLVKSDHVLKDLKAGTNIELVPTGDDVTINSTYTFTETPITTSGTGFTLKKADHVLKDLKAGTNIALDVTPEDITVRNTYTFTETVPSSAGTGKSIVSSGHIFKSLVEGTNILLTPSENEIEIKNTFTETATSSVGTGVSLQKATHIFKSLVEGDNITISNGENEITLSTPSLATASANGTSLVGSTSDHTVKSLVGDTGITVALDGTDAQMVRLTPNYPTLTSTGTGTGVLAHGVTKLGVKTLTPSTNVTVTNGTDTVTLSSTATTSMGTGTSIMKSDHVLKSLLAGTNVTITNTDDEVTINSTDLTSAHDTDKDYSLLTTNAHEVRGLRTGFDVWSSSLDNTLLIGKNWPEPIWSWEPSILPVCCLDGTNVRNIGGGNVQYMISDEMRQVSPGLGLVILGTKIPLTLWRSVRLALMNRSNPVTTTALMNTQNYEPCPTDYWMFMTVSMWYKTPTVLFHRTETNHARITLSMVNVSTPKWRVTVSVNDYSPGMYWEPDEIPQVQDVANGELYVFTVAFMYTNAYVKIKIQNSPLLRSPNFGTTGWTLETGATTFSTIPFTAKNTLLSRNVRGAASGIGGNTWSLFNNPNAGTPLLQEWYLFALYFYPPMTDEEANRAFAYHNRYSNYPAEPPS
jgi:hypothetical protein